jgi:hypothetical protein
VNALGSGDKNVKTDQSGRFILPLSSGQHIVLAQHPGFQTAAGVFRFASTETIDHEFTLTPNPDCPSGAAANPPTETLRASDFVEVEFPDQLLAGHRIRIRADGEVTWRGAALGGGISYHDIANVPAEDASALIEKYRSNGFWSLCADYAPYFLTIDAYLGYTTLQINGQIRRVADHEMAAPSLLHDLQRDFETVANAERWRRSLRHPAEWLLRVGPLSFQQARTQANARGNLNALDSGVGRRSCMRRNCSGRGIL